jgi:predicted membrane channel-forming protein YqfA (hemolysin III family)
MFLLLFLALFLSLATFSANSSGFKSFAIFLRRFSSMFFCFFGAMFFHFGGQSSRFRKIANNWRFSSGFNTRNLPAMSCTPFSMLLFQAKSYFCNYFVVIYEIFQNIPNIF